MHPSDILTPERIVIGLEAKSKKRLLQKMSTLFSETTESVNCETIFSALFTRERLGSTGMGHGVAIPHARIDNLDEVLGSLYVLPQAIDFQSADNQAVDLIFGLLVPSGANETHLHLLASIASIFDSVQFRDAIREMQNSQDIYQLLCGHGVS